MKEERKKGGEEGEEVEKAKEQYQGHKEYPA